MCPVFGASDLSALPAAVWAEIVAREGGDHVYPPAALERAMTIREVMLRAMSGAINWMQAAEIIGCTDRTVRRWRGYEGPGLRRPARSPTRAAVPAPGAVHGGPTHLAALSRALPRLQWAPLLSTRPAGPWRAAVVQLREDRPAAGGPAAQPPRARAPRRRREPRPCLGELLHLDGSRHRWLALVPDARQPCSPWSTTPRSNSCTPTSSRGARAAAIMRAAARPRGPADPGALYTDRAHWAVHTPTPGAAPDRTSSRRSAARSGSWASNISWPIRPRPAAAASA